VKILQKVLGGLPFFDSHCRHSVNNGASHLYASKTPYLNISSTTHCDQVSSSG